MLIDCAMNESNIGNDKIVWILIILFTSVLGAIIYRFVRIPKREIEIKEKHCIDKAINKSQNSALKGYHSEVALRINKNWSLSDVQNLPAGIEAILWITANTEGVVAEKYFDPKSENSIFDDAVLRALQKSLPLPPFPPELKEDNLEFALRFTSAGIEGK